MNKIQHEQLLDHYKGKLNDICITISKNNGVASFPVQLEQNFIINNISRIENVLELYFK